MSDRFDRMKRLGVTLILCLGVFLCGCQSDDPESRKKIMLLKAEEKSGFENGGLKGCSLDFSTGESFVLIKEACCASLGLISMNVWLNKSHPEVINSAITGIVLFDNWEQCDTNVSRDGSRIHFTISGVWTFKLGVGAFRYLVSFRGCYDLETNESDLDIL